MKFKDFVKECVRVLKITKKPSKQEFGSIVKVTGLGILVIGLTGFLIHMVMNVIMSWIGA